MFNSSLIYNDFLNFRLCILFVLPLLYPLWVKKVLLIPKPTWIANYPTPFFASMIFRWNFGAFTEELSLIGKSILCSSLCSISGLWSRDDCLVLYSPKLVFLLLLLLLLLLHRLSCDSDYVVFASTSLQMHSAAALDSWLQLILRKSVSSQAPIHPA